LSAGVYARQHRDHPDRYVGVCSGEVRQHLGYDRIYCIDLFLLGDAPRLGSS
jgi:hypothetical protein